MSAGQSFTLNRECPAIQIPSGESTLLPEGTQGMIMQSLGGTHTVTTNLGMVRIDGKDADALGLEVEKAKESEAVADPQNVQHLEELVWEKLKSVYDPEIPVNVVDLGLVYDIQVKDSDVYV